MSIQDRITRLVMQVMSAGMEPKRVCVRCGDQYSDDTRLEERRELFRELARNGTIELPEYFHYQEETRGIQELLAEWISNIATPLDFDELSDQDKLFAELEKVHTGLAERLLGMKKWYGYVSREINEEWEVPDEEDPDLEGAYEARDTDIDENEYDTLEDVKFIGEHNYEQIDIRESDGSQWVAFWATGGDIDMHGNVHEFHARLRRADRKPFTSRELERIQKLSGHRHPIQ